MFFFVIRMRGRGILIRLCLTRHRSSHYLLARRFSSTLGMHCDGDFIKSISQHQQLTASEVLQSAISKRSSVSVEFGTDGIQRNPFLLRLVWGSSGDIRSSSRPIRGSSGAVWGSSGLVRGSSTSVRGSSGPVRGLSVANLGKAGVVRGYLEVIRSSSGNIRASDPWPNPG